MKINRKFTSENQSPYETINFKKVSTEIVNPDGSLVFKLEDFEVFGGPCPPPGPGFWISAYSPTNNPKLLLLVYVVIQGATPSCRRPPKASMLVG